MGLGVWFREEIERAIWAAREALSVTVQAFGEGESDYKRGFRDGYEAALRTLANAFGVNPDRERRWRWP
jgi:hypothetical protein